MKTRLIVASEGEDNYLIFDIYKLDLADMATLIDWHNKDSEKVHKQIHSISEVSLNNSELPLFVKTGDFVNQKAKDTFIETYASEIAEKNDYFVNLVNWGGIPPKKPRASGEIKELIVPRLLIDRSFVLEEGLYVLVKDKNERNLEKVLTESGLHSSVTPPSKVDYGKNDEAFKEIIDAHLNNERSHIAFSSKEISQIMWFLVNTPMYKKLF
jgi:hypothetical protein